MCCQEITVSGFTTSSGERQPADWPRSRRGGGVTTWRMRSCWRRPPCRDRGRRGAARAPSTPNPPSCGAHTSKNDVCATREYQFALRILHPAAPSASLLVMDVDRSYRAPEDIRVGAILAIASGMANTIRTGTNTRFAPTHHAGGMPHSPGFAPTSRIHRPHRRLGLGDPDCTGPTSSVTGSLKYTHGYGSIHLHCGRRARSSRAAKVFRETSASLVPSRH